MATRRRGVAGVEVEGRRTGPARGPRVFGSKARVGRKGEPVVDADDAELARQGGEGGGRGS